MKLLGQVLDLKQADSADGRGAISGQYLRCSIRLKMRRWGSAPRPGDRTRPCTQATSVMLATFRVPPWNGPWFRRKGFTTMPESEAGAGLLAVLTWHASFLDMQIRETLWFPIIKARGVVQNSWIPLKNSVPSPS
jgi:hypothetical protein